MMPTPMKCTVMLQELTEHCCTIQQQCFQQCITSALSDVSSSVTSTSDSMSEVSESDLASLMSINTPDINVSSDVSMHSDDTFPTSSAELSDTNSLVSISDFEMEYYMNWQ
jgi:hypothetical protein